MQTQTQTAEYKGRKYRLLFIGQTKFGRRAHLQFFDGSRDFWCDASLVSPLNGGSHQGRARRHYDPDRHVCRACGHDGDMCADMDCTCRVCGGMSR
jgi:hypothetical protein